MFKGLAVAADVETCLACHSNPDSAPVVAVDKFHGSVHGNLSCEACHADAEIPHTKKPGPVDCSACHAEALRQLRQSPHGRAVLSHAPSVSAACASCHGSAHEARRHGDRNSRVSKANQPATCGSCHADARRAPQLPNGKAPLDSYALTVHGEAVQNGNFKAAVCADCHGSHDIRPPTDGESRVARRRIPDTCGRCHAGEGIEFLASVHGSALARGVAEAPACTDCHGEHTIRPPRDQTSSVWRGAVTKTCSGCHASERITTKFAVPSDRVGTFLDSYHGLAGKSGDLRVANCASCHGWHDILPASDPRSRVHPSNLTVTCGQCHPRAGLSLVSGTVHRALAGTGGASAVAAILRRIYLVFIPLVLLAMLVHNGLDFLRKALSTHHGSAAHSDGEMLLTAAERLQHGALILSFSALAYSGFALKFPGAWWAHPFAGLGGESVRLVFHRAAALAFVVLALVHVGYLFLAPKGRRCLRVLLPRPRDARDPLRLFLFNACISKERPHLERFSYIEKAEYWALIWGSGVMIATGAVLVFHNFALAHFPLWLIEASRVVHFMEAVLACLSILVWHFYWVIYDPDVYPMNWAWLTGRRRLRGKNDG